VEVQTMCERPFADCLPACILREDLEMARRGCCATVTRAEAKYPLPDGLVMLVNYHISSTETNATRNNELVLRITDITAEHLQSQTLDCYLGYQLVDRVLANGGLDLDGIRQEVTVMFVDIRDFTSMSERMDAAEVVAMLNEFFGALVPEVLANSGKVDKFIGDCMMAVFESQEGRQGNSHAYDACTAALQMEGSLASLNESRKRRGLCTISAGFGIHSDVVISGNIGSTHRLEHTVIGDGVNVASRIEGLTKQYDCSIIISDTTRTKVGDGVFSIREIDLVQVKGKTTQMKIYELF